MAADLIRYDLMVQEALRGVVRRVLTDVGRYGLPGDHHLYVSFKTGHAGVRISNRLREQYPDEMTIVLQHQYWDLKVHDHGFEVVLSFKNVHEQLVVPYDAVVGFFDPSVQFGLKFEPDEAAAPEAAAPAGKPTSARKPDGSPPAKPPKGAKPEQAASGEAVVDMPDPVAAPIDGPKVISLDAFRKKP
jgi:hypothetical protein